jgi:hypothetical protein
MDTPPETATAETPRMLERWGALSMPAEVVSDSWQP